MRPLVVERRVMRCCENMKGWLLAAVGAVATAWAPATAGRAPAKKPPVKHVLTISTATKQPAAGRVIKFTVRVTTPTRKPVVRAAVFLRFQSSPSKDARLVPKVGKTNARGIFRGTLRLGRKPGVYVLVAQAGRFSARLRLVSRPVRAVSHVATNPILAWVALATIGLVLLGIFVNLEVLRRLTWSLTIGRFTRRRATRRS